ncbi:MAG TPA: J domain-containing protein [Acidimicrobiales bacterium]|nr:J domain-containing protein [Acidimicrobiales bacterium]
MDAYAVLGVAPSATDEEIREAYLRRSKELHPDRYADASARDQAMATRAMQQLNVAYDELRHRRAAAPPPPPPPFTAPPRPRYAPPTPSATPPAPPRRGRVRWFVVVLAALLLTSVLALVSGDSNNGHPSSPSASVQDFTNLEGTCVVFDSRGGLSDFVDCTRAHDARIMRVVDHGTACPPWTDGTVAGPRQDLCVDTHQ